MRRFLNVLVIEDDPAIRQILIESLQADPRIDVDSAGTLREGARKAAMLRENAVLVDITMSDLSNADVVAAINHLAPGATVIALTSGNEEEQKSILAAGADAVIDKHDVDASGHRLVTKLREVVIRRAHDVAHQLVFESLDRIDSIIAEAKAAADGQLALRSVVKV